MSALACPGSPDIRNWPASYTAHPPRCRHSVLLTSALMPEIYCCVDIEASGHVPGLYDIVSLGAVAVVNGAVADGEPFYVEIAPQGGRHDPDAMKIHGITREHLEREGLPLRDALLRLNGWAEALRGTSKARLVFVG